MKRWDNLSFLTNKLIYGLCLVAFYNFDNWTKKIV